MKPTYPVHSLLQFKNADIDAGFYVNNLRTHLQLHPFVMRPHKHDFYLIVFCTQGHGTHYIDFNAFEVKPGSLFFLFPGQSHQWDMSDDMDGYILFHSRAFYETVYSQKKINDYPFFFCKYNRPVLYLSKEESDAVEHFFTEVIREFRGNELAKYQKICSLLDLTYIDMTRYYLRGGIRVAPDKVHSLKIRQLDQLIDQHFRTIKSPAGYAELMHTSTKQLNRICKEALEKTTSELILERIVIEAKRLLVQDSLSIADIAAELGYLDTGYFIRVFRKQTGETPTEFRKRSFVRLPLL